MLNIATYFKTIRNWTLNFQIFNFSGQSIQQIRRCFKMLLTDRMSFATFLIFTVHRLQDRETTVPLMLVYLIIQQFTSHLSHFKWYISHKNFVQRSWQFAQPSNRPWWVHCQCQIFDKISLISSLKSLNEHVIIRTIQHKQLAITTAIIIEYSVSKHPLSNNCSGEAIWKDTCKTQNFDFPISLCHITQDSPAVVDGRGAKRLISSFSVSLWVLLRWLSVPSVWEMVISRYW